MKTGFQRFHYLHTSLLLLALTMLPGCNGDVSSPEESSTAAISIHNVSPSFPERQDSTRSRAEEKPRAESAVPETEECVEGDQMVCACTDPDDGVNYKVISPNGGEVWTVGSVVTIHFCSDYTDTNEVRNCEIDISPNNGLNWHSLRNRGNWVSSGGAPHIYNWTVVESFLAQGDDGLMRVELADRPLMLRIRTYYGDKSVDFDTNDQPFTIQGTSASVRH